MHQNVYLERFISKKQYKYWRNKVKEKQLLPIKLHFDINDISHIILKSNSELANFINHIRSDLFKKNFTKDHIDIFISKITSIENTRNDF